MAILRGCCCCREQKVDRIINGSAICLMWVSIIGKFFIGEICYHDNQLEPVLPSLLIMSALSQLFLVAVAIYITVDSYRNNAKSITIFIFLLNIIVIILGLIFVSKGWNNPQMDSGNINPVVTKQTPSNERDSSVKHLSYSVSITTFPSNKASTQHSVPEKQDFHHHKKSCRDLILVCATIAFPVDGLLTVSVIVIFIFSVKIKDAQDISQGFHDDEIPLLESIENKRILKEE
ncbi:hypothetical protein ACJMK2_012783 [Sinanodonta woodiana]|uniref:Uncharacterized protein n=1 Tax=Sinanodonta woodiana TaxID=1069815 RepID=A0ABD3VCA0_SINWO